MQTNKPVLLSVDDEPGVLKALQRTLRKLDAEFLSATSGKEALSIMADQHIDVILSDMRMPVMDGPAFLKEAAKLQPHTRRLVLTGYADVDAAKSAINDGGISNYLSKPWDDEELRNILTEALRTASLERENSYLSDLAQSQNAELASLNEELEARVARRTEALEHTNGKLGTTLRELEESHDQMIDLVANIAALPNRESIRTAEKLALAIAIGKALELGDEELHDLRNATRLHRLGWVGIPSRTTAKCWAEMSNDDRLSFEKHPALAQAVLLNVPRLHKTGDIVGGQHEAFNGTGFPNRQVGEGIPIGSRILAISRDYVDYCSGRIVSKEQTPKQARQYINDQSGKLYDPALVVIFNNVVDASTNTNTQLNEICLDSMSLMPGMRLSRDLTTSEGVVLLAKGKTLSETGIATLLNLERRSDQALKVYTVNEPT